MKPSKDAADKLDAAEIANVIAALKTGPQLRPTSASSAPKIVVRDTIGSTSDEAKALAAKGAAEGTLVVADAQTQGRGRTGNTWSSPPGANLYLSFVLRPSIEPSRVAPLALVHGVVVAGIIEAALRASEPAPSPLQTGMKWPNDVFVNGSKIAGILIESQIRGAEVTSVVVGVGLNVHADRETFPEELRDRATSLKLCGVVGARRSRLAGEIVARSLAAVNVYGLLGLAPFLAEIRARDVLSGKSVRVGDVLGIARGIDDDGKLIIERADGEKTAVQTGHVELADLN